MELLKEIIMPDFPRTVRLSEHRRPKYFKPKDKLALKYLLKFTLKYVPEFKPEIQIAQDNKGNWRDLIYPYRWREHKLTKGRTEWRLYNDETKEFIIKNPSVAGTPNDEIINGQKMYNGEYHPNVRAKIMEAIHAYMIPFLQGLTPITEYPIIIRGYMYDKGKTCEISKGRMWDVGNRQFPYNKGFEDMLQHCGIIKQDDFEHIVAPTALEFVNMDTHSLPKAYWKGNHCRTLVYQIYKVCQ